MKNNKFEDLHLEHTDKQSGRVVRGDQVDQCHLDQVHPKKLSTFNNGQNRTFQCLSDVNFYTLDVKMKYELTLSPLSPLSPLGPCRQMQNAVISLNP